MNNDEARKEFEYILKNYVLPIIPTKGELIFKKCNKPYTTSNLIKLHKKKYYTIYPCFNNPLIFYRIEAEDQCPSLGAAEEILREIMKISQYLFNNPKFPYNSYYDLDIDGHYVYRINRYNLAFEIGLCNWLGGKSVFRLLEKMRSWSQKTYEGKRIPFSFLIDANNKAKGIDDFIEFLDNNHSAVFTDGMTSGISLDNKGYITGYFSTNYDADKREGKKLIPLAPYRFRDIASRCYTDKNQSVWIGIIAQTNGDILIFKNRSLVFAKRNGKWLYLNAKRIIDRIKEFIIVEDGIKDYFAKEIYLTLLDVTFARTGGCLAIIKEEYKDSVIQKYISFDYLDNDEKNKEKKAILKRLMCAGADNENRIFYCLDRKLRQELLGLDGATVIDTTGRIICSGAIVKIDGGSEEGGRTAAAIQLSSYGFAVKISMDGHIRGFHGRDGDIRTVNQVLTMF